MTSGDFIVERIPIRRDGYVIHSGRKLSAKGFLFGVIAM